MLPWSSNGGDYLRILECRWVCGDIVIATSGQSRAPRVSEPYRASIVSAERSVEDDVMVCKVRVDVARTLEIGLRRAPQRRIRFSGRNIGRNRASCKKPYSNVVGGPLRRVDTAITTVETSAVASCCVC